jgi:protein gp37
MSDNTGIDYLDATWNPIIMRCDRVGTGCANCWHLPMAKRHAANPTRPESHRAAYSGGPFVLSETALTLPMKWKKPRRIGVQFMGDLYHKDVPFEWIDRVKAVEALCPQHTFIELTKRPERMAEYFAGKPYARVLVEAREAEGGDHSWNSVLGWPLPNVLLGTSVENQQAADERIPHLLNCPAAVRFLSCEPLLGSVDLSKYIGYNPMYETTNERRRALRRGTDGPLSDSGQRGCMEDRRVAREQMERTAIIASNQPTEGRTPSRKLHAGEVDEGVSPHSLHGSPISVATLQRINPRGDAGESRERGQAGQPPTESRTGDTEREQKTLLQGGNIGRVRPEEPSGEADRFASSGNSDHVPVGSKDTEANRNAVSRRTSNGVEDCSRGQAEEAARTHRELHASTQSRNEGEELGHRQIHLVIVGGESGPKARPCNVEWIRSIVEQCKAAEAACFVKQVGAYPVDPESSVAHTVAESRCWPSAKEGRHGRIMLKSAKGGDMREWPEDLRVRQLPETPKIG